MNMDIYQCVDNTYGISVSPIASNVAYDPSFNTTGSYLISNLNASTTYYYAITATGSKTVLQTLTFQTSTQPTFGGTGGTASIVFSNFSNSGWAAPCVNAENSKMIAFKRGDGLYYATSSNNGTTWSGLSLFYSYTGDINYASLSYKGDIGLIIEIGANRYISTIKWNGLTPSCTSNSTNSGSAEWTSVNTIMDGKFAIATQYGTGDVYYSNFNNGTGDFDTFTKSNYTLGTYNGFNWNGCFNSSSTIFIGTGYLSNIIKVLKIDRSASTPSISLLASFTLSSSVLNSTIGNAGIFLVGGKNSTGIYIFQNKTVSYSAFDDSSLNNIPNLTLSFNTKLTNYGQSLTTEPSGLYSMSSIGYGNKLYYYTGYNGTNIYSIRF